MTYTYTPLEDLIKRLYHHIGITTPAKIDMIEIAATLNVWLHFTDMGSRSLARNNMHSIIIDRRLTPQEQWIDFGHELCHVLLHEGNQLNLPPLFIDMQEYKANNFMLHFCVPTFMLRKLNIPQLHPVSFISETFNVPHWVASERLSHYQRQLMQAKKDNHYRLFSQWKDKKRKHSYNLPPFKVADCSQETHKFMKQWEDKL